MQWMGIYGCIITPLSMQVQIQIWEISRNPKLVLGYKWHDCTNVEAWDKLNLYHTSISYIHKVIDNRHMQWMHIWTHHHSIINECANSDLENQQKSWVTVGVQTIPFQIC